LMIFFADYIFVSNFQIDTGFLLQEIQREDSLSDVLLKERPEK
jgi:hypothetical protein